MKLASIHRYPVKGCRAQDLNACLVQDRGLQGDRRYMLVDARGTFCCQRKRPAIGRLLAAAHEDDLLLEDSLRVSPTLAHPIEVKVWRDKVTAYHQPVADARLQDTLQAPLRLVHMPANTRRLTPQGDEVSFADGYPLLITTTASLAALNEHVQPPRIAMAAFRPNLVIHTQTAWEEDSWRRIRVGQVEIELISPCVRCKVTTLDPNEPETAHPHREPLKSLQTLRMDPVAKGVTFGWNAVLRSPPATLRVGDSVDVLETKR